LSLTQILKSDDANLREFVCTALGDIGPEAKAAIPALTSALKDGSRSVVLTAHYALAKNTSDPQKHIAVLCEALKHSDSNIRILSVWCLEKMGSEAKAAVPNLVVLLSDQNANIRKSALRTLKEVTGEDLGSSQNKWHQWWEANRNK